MSEWIKVTTRPATEDEQEHYRELWGIDTDAIFNCRLPDDGQEVLISCGGYVTVDTFCKDGDECFFDCADIEEVDAWMPLPAPFKESEGTDADSD